MNQLIPKYSFIKLFLPYARYDKYRVLTYINHNISEFDNVFTLNNMRINTNIIIRKEYYSNDSPNYNYIKTDVELLFDDNKINELVKINYSDNLFKIDYELKKNNEDTYKINIPEFKICNNNYDLLLENYKFVEKSTNDDNYKLFLQIEKNIDQVK